MRKPPRNTHDDSASMHGTLLAIALLMIALLLAPEADAQPRPVQPHDPGQTQSDPARVPDWVVPGARITLYGASAQHEKINPGRNARWREEERRARQADIDAGLSADEVERRAREREEARAADRRMFKIGRGIYSFTQYDIIAVTDAGVLIESRSYDISPLGGQPEIASSIGKLLVDHATGGGLWILPEVIENTPQSQGEDGGLIVYKSPYTIGEHTYDTITIINAHGEYNRRHVYDCATGIRLYESELTDTRLIRAHTFRELVGYRVAQLPWIGTQFSQEMQDLHKLTYEGALVFVAPQLGAEFDRLPDTRFETEAEFEFTAASPDIIATNITCEMDMPTGPDQTTRVQSHLSPNERFGLYIDPAVLAQLEIGQVIDEDPAIGYTIRVSDIYEVDGTTLVEFTEVGPRDSYNAVVTYDASVGLQVAGTSTHPTQKQRIEVTLDRVE